MPENIWSPIISNGKLILFSNFIYSGSSSGFDIFFILLGYKYNSLLVIKIFIVSYAVIYDFLHLGHGF